MIDQAKHLIVQWKQKFVIVRMREQRLLDRCKDRQQTLKQYKYFKLKAEETDGPKY